jgi:hypothetical protein
VLSLIVVEILNTNFTSSTSYFSGSITQYHTDKRELFTGELGGTVITVHSQSNENIIYEYNNLPISSSQDVYNNLYRIPINPILNNVSIARTTPKHLDIDYAYDPIMPVNNIYLTRSLLSNLNDQNPFLFASVQDSNYTMNRHIIPRYNGSKLTGALYNSYSLGDISYGKNPVIDLNSVKFAYFNEITSQSLTLPGRVNANIKYLIDSASSVVELTEANKSLFDVQSIFNRVNANVALDNINQPSKQKKLNGLHSIYAGGFKYYPIYQNVNSTTSSLTFELVNPIQTSVPSGSGTGSIIPINDPNLVQVNNIRFATLPTTGSIDAKNCFVSLNSHLIVDITKNITLNQDIYIKVSGSVTFTSYVSPGGTGEKPVLYNSRTLTGASYTPPNNGPNNTYLGGQYSYQRPYFNSFFGAWDTIGSMILPAGMKVNIHPDDNNWGSYSTYFGPAKITGQNPPPAGFTYDFFLSQTNRPYGADGFDFELLTTSGSLATDTLFNPFNPATGISQNLLVLDTVDPVTNQRAYTSYPFTDGSTLAAKPLILPNGIGCTITFEVKGIIKIPSNITNGVITPFPIGTLDSPTIPAVITARAKYKTIEQYGAVNITSNPINTYNVNPIYPNGIYYYGQPPQFNYTYIIKDLGKSGSSAPTQFYFERGKGDTDNFYYLTASHYMSQYYYQYIDPVPNPTDSNLFTQINSSFMGYEDVELPFTPKRGDLIRLYDHDRGIFPVEFEGEIVEINPPISYPIDSSSYTNRLVFKINNPILNQSCWDYLTQIQNFIFLSKVKDETNVILNTDKNPGQTSAGILLPEYLDPETKENAGDIIKSLKSQNLI